MVEDTQNLADNTIQHSLKERIQNRILHVQFEHKISLSQSNSQILCIHNMDQYICTKLPKTTENAKTRQNAYFKMASKGRKLLYTCFILDPSNVFGLSRTIFLTRTMGKGGGGGERIFRLCPLLGSQGILTESNLNNAQLDHVFYKIRL